MAQLCLIGEAGTAMFSSCGIYRYRLTRAWGYGAGTLNVIGLNCSIATAEVDDPTIRRCIGFAREWGYARLVMTNVFAYRATDPAVMKRVSDPVGPENDRHLRAMAEEADLVLAAWGGYGIHLHREQEVVELLEGIDLWCLGLTGAGHPRHPLYVARNLKPRPWRSAP